MYLYSLTLQRATGAVCRVRRQRQLQRARHEEVGGVGVGLHAGDRRGPGRHARPPPPGPGAGPPPHAPLGRRLRRHPLARAVPPHRRQQGLPRRRLRLRPPRHPRVLPGPQPLRQGPPGDLRQVRLPPHRPRPAARRRPQGPRALRRRAREA
ncbi:hypothetical protein PVAP13_1KG042408 [Panicum virgatum]|uniref:Uncharacterized protein n=1 Tax=Panicum virgatum TaxID=38727 RepID=A0A8T0XA32_PANVG|nr:hypothetical protein PVAP13_1KG042408 [Panicum virgatum]